MVLVSVHLFLCMHNHYTPNCVFCHMLMARSACMQVREALLFSASLRLQNNPSTAETQAFTDEVMDIVELTPLANALVGSPGRQAPTPAVFRAGFPCMHRLISMRLSR